ncbi:cytochrome P450 [Novosphingobium mangrovi (ex Huang et al. 2023)]|uniref:Cytochrome P450 n=1 Tax=Novosphingobium mangrovi (ex Huang et al. 2023) TaxID=2976432 RepID=A0ABT2I3G1_9SPHN|nr:cytochrome P450 [Novosphingobium mangrovi (ex Huang et al. 2023)]MCT2399132.1 cytochrome P450 [Novosphingobium mangrovi (ex Huang et al. 2023)]
MASCPVTGGNSNALASLMSDNPRYAEMFDVNNEAANAGVDNNRDYTDDMNALRDKAAVQKGSLRELLGVPELPMSMGTARDSMTFFSYRACEIGFRENLIFSSEGYNESPGVRTIGTTILSMVGKPHKRLRSAAQPLFKRPKVIDWWNKRWIEGTVDALLDRLLENETADLNIELCARLPMATVTRAIGLEGEDVIEFRYQLTRATFGAAKLPPEEAAESRAIVDRTLRDLIAENTRTPGDNLIAGLIAAEIVDEDTGDRRPLTEDEIFGYCKLAIFAGGGTTWRQLGITIDALMTHYHFWEACREDRSLVEAAVEESLRWRCTDPMMPRLCVEDYVVEGVMVPAGTRVYLCFGAANHDPAVYERPEEYDIFRKKSAANMGFGFGPHRCLGIEVARQEMIVAINGLLDRFPNMQYDSTRPRPEFRGLEHRGMTSVPVILK